MTTRDRINPHDTPISAATRFAAEVAAWTAGPWTAARLSGSTWVAVLVAAVLLTLPAVFNVPGDKKVTGIAVPGGVRFAIELLLLAVAVAGAWTVWPTWPAVVVSAAAATTVIAGGARYRWMLAGGEGSPLRR